MKNYIYVLVLLVGCGEYDRKAETIAYTDTSMALPGIDSIRLNMKHDVRSLGLYVDRVEARIARLEKEKKDLLDQKNDPAVSFYAMEKNSSSEDNRIERLNEKLRQYEKQIFDLRNELTRAKEKNKTNDEYTSYNRNDFDQVIEYVVPNEKSLMIRVTGKTETGISIFIMPYSKKAKRAVMNYDLFCDYGKMNELGARQANYYDGEYFFNDVPKGKYIVKLCAFYGSFTVVKRDEEGLQTVSIPIQ